MSTTVEVGGFTVSGSGPSEDVISSLTPKDAGEQKPDFKVLVKDGVKVTPEDESKESLSKAASELGKKGGAAAAEKRAAEKEAPAEPEVKAEPAKEPEAKEEPEPKEEKPLGKPRDDPRARMLQATQREAAAKREAAQERAARQALEARLAALEQAQKPAEGKPPTRPAQGDPEPKAEEFEDYNDFLDKRSRWAVRDETRRVERARAQADQERVLYEGSRMAQESYNAQCKEAVAKDPSFEARAKPVASLFPGPSTSLKSPLELTAGHVATDELLFSAAEGKAPALLLYFAEHPDELQRIFSLPLRSPEDLQEIQIEMRSIVRGLKAATSGNSPEAKSVSKAPAPVRPVTGSPHTASVGGYREGDSFDEWLSRQKR